MTTWRARQARQVKCKHSPSDACVYGNISASSCQDHTAFSLRVCVLPVCVKGEHRFERPSPHVCYLAWVTAVTPRYAYKQTHTTYTSTKHSMYAHLDYVYRCTTRGFSLLAKQLSSRLSPVLLRSRRTTVSGSAFRVNGCATVYSQQQQELGFASLAECTRPVFLARR